MPEPLNHVFAGFPHCLPIVGRIGTKDFNGYAPYGYGYISYAYVPWYEGYSIRRSANEEASDYQVEGFPDMNRSPANGGASG
jgi:hypothetical protein